MSQSFFILGRNPKLSAWEIINKLSLKPRSFITTPDFIICPLSKPPNSQELLKELGGTIKMGKIINQIDVNKLKSAQTIELLANYLSGKPRPIFGLSYYGQSGKLREEMTRIGLSVKTLLKTKNISSRLVTSKQTVLSSVVVAKNHLLHKGAEFVWLSVDKKIYLGVTETVQEFAEYSQRDFGRPSRDNHSGMIPPKLAKIMINLAGIKKTDSLLDPFCGSGTILQEAMLLGYRQIIGSDISDKAVRDSKNNIDWLI
ncbi:hypothetical protein KKI23_04150, partial [Patescibacteria group bacterium]|nr:hypothetical protein [Patescibacteria group bacterium]